MTQQECWSLVIQGAVAAGTLALAVLAIWGDFVRSILASPQLYVRLNSVEGELTYLSDGQPIRYYHVAVGNGRRWAPARNVRVFLRRLERPGPDGNWQPAMASTLIPLTWQFPQFVPESVTTVGPDRLCDFGAVTKQGVPLFRLTPEFEPNNFRGTLVGGERLR